MRGEIGQQTSVNVSEMRIKPPGIRTQNPLIRMLLPVCLTPCKNGFAPSDSRDTIFRGNIKSTI